MPVPKRFAWILKEEGTMMIQEAMKLYGTLEVPGKGNNSTILAWAQEVGGNVEDVYKADSIPWCGLFMALVAKRGKKTPPKDPLWALNWGTFGKHVDVPMYGDVLVFTRKTDTGSIAGHVGMYVAESTTTYFVLAGNQKDAVNIAEIDKKRLYTARRPAYINQPDCVRRIKVSSTGVISNYEQ